MSRLFHCGVTHLFRFFFDYTESVKACSPKIYKQYFTTIIIIDQCLHKYLVSTYKNNWLNNFVCIFQHFPI